MKQQKKKMDKLHSYKSLEQVSMTESELQICLALLAINICEIKVNLTEGKLGYICVFWFAATDRGKGFLVKV